MMITPRKNNIILSLGLRLQFICIILYENNYLIKKCYKKIKCLMLKKKDLISILKHNKNEVTNIQVIVNIVFHF